MESRSLWCRLAAAVLAGQEPTREREVRDEPEPEACTSAGAPPRPRARAMSTRSARRRTPLAPARPPLRASRESSSTFRRRGSCPRGQARRGSRSSRRAVWRDPRGGAGRGRRSRSGGARGSLRALSGSPRASQSLGGRPAELRGEHDSLPPPPERLAEERLAPPVAVALGGVEERHAGLERRVDDRARPVLVDAPAEVVAAEADDGDLERSEASHPHAAERTGGAAESRLTRARGGGHLKRPRGERRFHHPPISVLLKAASTSSTLDAMSRTTRLARSRRVAAGVVLLPCIVLLLGTPTSSSAGSSPNRAREVGATLPTTVSGRYVIAGGIRAMVRVGRAVYVGGEFGRIANRTGSGIVVPAKGGKMDEVRSEIAGGSVNAVLADGVGGWYCRRVVHDGWRRPPERPCARACKRRRGLGLCPARPRRGSLSGARRDRSRRGGCTSRRPFFLARARSYDRGFASDRIRAPSGRR